MGGEGANQQIDDHEVLPDCRLCSERAAALAQPLGFLPIIGNAVNYGPLGAGPSQGDIHFLGPPLSNLEVYL